MSNWLERIEEKHSGEHWCRTTGDEPCDVVKLARALAQFIRAKKYTSGVSLEFATAEAEHTLREVAND